MRDVAEYLYYHDSEDYANLKFVSCTYYRKQQRLVVRYIYATEIEAQLAQLKPKLESAFIKEVGLPLKYDFVYKKVYVDNLMVQLEIVSFLRRKFGKLADNTTDTDVKVELSGNAWQINLFLPVTLIDFLEHSQQWQKFVQSLRDKNFYDVEIYFNVRN